jgi:hypothetical protein
MEVDPYIIILEKYGVGCEIGSSHSKQVPETGI